MKYFSTFSGIGGFEVGIERAFANKLPAERLELVGYSEIDKYASSVYERHNQGVHNYGDITKINAEQLPDFDLLVGGFPCQAFSLAGKRRGFEDTRGTLFFDLARILKAKAPRLFVFENVKGLLSHDHGNTFATIISAIDDLGYDCQWQVLNSKDFGVPQNRERIIIVGHLRGTARPEVFPILGTDSKDLTPGVPAEQRAQSIATRHLDRNGKLTSDIASTVQVAEVPHVVANLWGGQSGRVYGTDGVSPTLTTMTGGGNKQPKIINPKMNNYSPSELSVAITASSYKEPPVVLPLVRRLTPVECERLQAFPETEASAIIEVQCTDQQDSYANAESQNLKLQKYALNVASDEPKEIALSAQSDSLSSYPPTNRPVQPSVHINCVENGVEINYQGKLLLSVNTATSKYLSALPMPIDDFVQLCAATVRTAERIIHAGKAVSQTIEQPLIPVSNGNRFEKSFGNEMMQRAKNAADALITPQDLTKFITSCHSDTNHSDLNLATLYYCVMNAITGFIPEEIRTSSMYQLHFNVRVGWTKYGKDNQPISDTQRYKMCGNAVTTSVIQAVFEKLLSQESSDASR